MPVLPIILVESCLLYSAWNSDTAGLSIDAFGDNTLALCNSGYVPDIA